MTSAFFSRKSTRATLVVGATIAIASTGSAAAHAAGHPHSFGVAPDSFSGPNGTTTEISGEGFGSSLVAVPGRPGFFYGLRDYRQRHRQGNKREDSSSVKK